MDDLDQTLDAIEKALSPATAERANRVARSIAKLRERREELYDKAFPIGGIGVCRDGAALKAYGEIDDKIHDLTRAREDLLSGKGAVSAEPIANTPATPRALPAPPAFEEKELINPFDGLEAVPSGDEYSKLTDDAFHYAFDRIYIDILKFRKAMHDDASAHGDRAIAYTNHIHLGVVGSIAKVWSEMRTLFAISRDKRKSVEEQVSKLVARIEELEQRPFLVDAGVWSGEKTYPAGSFVSHQGAGWIAKVQTTSCRPGEGNLWRLAVKSFKER